MLLMNVIFGKLWSVLFSMTTHVGRRVDILVRPPRKLALIITQSITVYINNANPHYNSESKL